MIERALPGEIIVTVSVREQRRLSSLLERAGKKEVRVVVFEPRKLDQHRHRLRNAVVHFDHQWVRDWYQWRLDQIHAEMTELGKLGIHTRKHETDIRHADLYGAITWLSGERPIRYDP
ncbi:hypothetical protein [Sphingomonas sp. 2378]|uniref:hypothetical protein n=1 Tax=Sphingomonas sp. 2378 TaxID=1219748 RepID=UPI00311ACF41